MTQTLVATPDPDDRPAEREPALKTLDDGAPVLESEVGPVGPALTLELNGAYAGGEYVFSVGSDQGVSFALTCSDAGLPYLEVMIASVGPAVENLLERILEAREADSEPSGE